MLVRDRMSSPAFTVRPDASFQQALALMQEKSIRRLPVVDDAGRLVGIVAQRDVLIAALRYLQPRVDVAQVMATSVVTTTPETSLERVAQTMIDNKIGGLPVVEGDAVVGMITESDIFRCFVELHKAAERASAAARSKHAPGLSPVD